MQYLCNKYAPDSLLYPDDPQKRATVDRLLNFDLKTLCKAVISAHFEFTVRHFIVLLFTNSYDELMNFYDELTNF